MVEGFVWFRLDLLLNWVGGIGLCYSYWCVLVVCYISGVFYFSCFFKFYVSKLVWIIMVFCCDFYLMFNNLIFFYDGWFWYVRDCDVNDYFSLKFRCLRLVFFVLVWCLMVVCEIVLKGLFGFLFLEVKGFKGGGGGDKFLDICY